MTQEQAKETIKRYLKEYVESLAGQGKKIGGGSWQYKCPIPNCNSGNGRHRTGAFTIYDATNRYKCFSCGESGDIFSLIGICEGISDFPSQLKWACNRFNIILDDYKSPFPFREKEQDKTRQTESAPELQAREKLEQEKETPEAKAQKEQNKKYIKLCVANQSKSNYLTERGISAEIQKRFNIGYDLEKNLLIIPNSEHSYNARTIKGDKCYKKSKGESELFNLNGIEHAKSPIFLTEGEIDALSIIEAGGEAVALSTTGNHKIIEYLAKHKITQPLIIALDNDSAGDRGSEKLKSELESKRIESFNLTKYLYGEYKDANETLTADGKAFKERVKSLKDLTSIKQALRAQTLADYQKKTAKEFLISEFMASIDNPPKRIETGLKPLDNALNGGLLSGLYIIGAISSLGKTTFCLNIIDNIAKQGKDILYITLEQARKELIAKSLSKITALKSLEKYNGTQYASTSSDVLEYGSQRIKSQKERKEIISQAFRDYHNFSGNIYFIESVSGVKAEDIEEQVKEHITITGNKPIVVIDYLQLLAPNDMRATDKQNMDSAVLTLKRLCRDYDITILAISSFNRDNYNTSANLASFKESGIIEYSADVVIGLQYYGLEQEIGEKDKERAERVAKLIKENKEKAKSFQSVDIEAKILKNRNGAKDSFILSYYPAFNYFLEYEQKQDSDVWE